MRNTLLQGCFLAGALVVTIVSTGCATRERVVVRERPAVVVAAPPQAVVVERPVVRETVIVRP